MKILIVEDNAVLAKKISDWLAQAHYTVDIAKTGKEADSLIETSSYQAVILDIGLPDENGLSLMQDGEKTGKKRPSLF